MLHAILGEIEKDGKPQVYENVRLILVGGQSITSPQLERSKIYFPTARIVQTFACTEAGSSITFSTVADPNTSKDGTAPSVVDVYHKERQVQGSNVGSPPHHVALQIFRLDANNKPTNNIVSPYQIGAIGTKGPHVMNGYWKRGQDILNHSIGTNDWLILNDIGYLDDRGRLFFCGRSNDVIRTGGETVFSPEVEHVLVQHPSVDQCAVFALPDEKFGECVSAAIVFGSRRRSKENFPEYSKDICLANRKELREFREFCAERQLAAYKHPRVIFFCDELPCNSSGKVLKHLLVNKCSAIRDKVQSRL
jgi:acyl-CoA synthetase (AMP-forming)/AMP-acid ligase II